VEEIYSRLKTKNKSKMSIADLCVHHDFRLTKKTSTICPNQRCNCLRILENRDARAAVVKYLAWFSKKDAYEQGSIVFEWYRYSASFLIPGQQDPRVIGFGSLTSTMASTLR
jgi:hypothetical protein